MRVNMDNEVPDVICVATFNSRTELCPPGELGGVAYIRDGAPSPWIDPSVQPIPEDLYLDTPAYVKRKFNDREICLLLDVDRAKDLFRDGLLLGYIILPPE